MLRLGILVGLAAGAITALLMAKPELPEGTEPEVVEGDDLQARMKRVKVQVRSQLQQARKAAREAADATEAEMRHDFEATLRQSRKDQG